jgi:hypothetical protein
LAFVNLTLLFHFRHRSLCLHDFSLQTTLKVSPLPFGTVVNVTSHQYQLFFKEFKKLDPQSGFLSLRAGILLRAISSLEREGGRAARLSLRKARTRLQDKVAKVRGQLEAKGK